MMNRVGRGITSVLAGTALVAGGYAAYEAVGLIPDIVETPAQVGACARYLGTTATTSEKLPGECNEVPGLFHRTEVHVYEPGKDGQPTIKTSYVLPSMDEFRTKSVETISMHKKQEQQNDRHYRYIAGYLALFSTVAFYNITRQ